MRDAIGIRTCMIGGMTAAVLALLLLAPSAPSTAQQPCNPVIDGTYCATQPGRSGASPGSSTRFHPIGGIAGDILADEQSQPATLGAITFQGNASRCIGLLRRSNCS
jgi:hypothetical protein